MEAGATVEEAGTIEEKATREMSRVVATFENI
jgi:hypothetical protein